MPLVYRCADAHDTTVAVGSDAPDAWTCCVCGQPATRISACERSSAEVATALDDECAAFDADPAMTLFQWAVETTDRLVDAHGGLMRVDADLKAAMLGRIGSNVLAYMQHMRALRFPAEPTDCAVTYVGAGVGCCHYPPFTRSGPATPIWTTTVTGRPGGRSGMPAATSSPPSRSTWTMADRSDRISA